MTILLNSPAIVLLVSVLVLWLAARIGYLLRKRRDRDEGAGEDFGVVLAATLTLLGLIIGFTFSMATSRYDQRKNYEEAEANAIGTAYVRADLLPSADAVKIRAWLRTYTHQRVLFYTTRSARQLQQIDADTVQLQSEMWSLVAAHAAAQPTPVGVLVATGMNDVLNSQGYTQSAWWNRIPVAAWALMALIAICCNLLLGYSAHRTGKRDILFAVLPLVVSIAFFLIAELDSPRSGVIRVHPRNLISLDESLPR